MMEKNGFHGNDSVSERNSTREGQKKDTEDCVPTTTKKNKTYTYYHHLTDYNDDDDERLEIIKF
ncbi:hypothetical protein DERF_012805 [Dermatophagoides farinae]|uniref:Uncharacterized protein n=1 Tax=Dermatophagoides farinae TaxID=6954 RepID=A0A922HSM1_DERFA|nr:hypothetical protein DERF_012805 [Dermatophagoides farinae]